MQKLSLRRFERFSIIAIPAMAVFVRLAFGLSRLQDVPTDPDHYIPLAHSLIAGQGFAFDGRPTAYRPPLYPIVIAPLVAILGHGKSFHAALVVFQAILGGATTWLAIRAASRAGDLLSEPNTDSPESRSIGSFACWFTGVLTALDPVLVSQAPLVMTETLAAFLVTGAIHAIMHDRFRSAGLWFGASSLCRPSMLACMMLTVFARLIPTDRAPRQRRFADVARLAIFCSILLLPWGLRNLALFGDPVLTTTHGGYTLALANNAVYFEDVVFGPPGAVWTGPRQQAWMDTIGTDTVGLPEPEADRRMKAKAFAFIRSHPREFSIACVQRQLRFWAIAPSAQIFGSRVRSLCAIWTVPFWFFAIFALRIRSCWIWPTLAILTVITSLAIVHLVYWTDIRMRAPIVPTLAILAGIGAESAIRRIKR